MEIKYYIPDISDIRVGYECETKVYPYPNWIKTKIEDGEDIEFIFSKQWEIRVPYLTKEQIESEGWIVDNSMGKIEDNLLFNKKGKFREDDVNYKIYYVPKTKWLLIYLGDYLLRYTENKTELTTNNTLFAGYCPSINEFRYITKNLLKI